VRECAACAKRIRYRAPGRPGFSTARLQKSPNWLRRARWSPHITLRSKEERALLQMLYIVPISRSWWIHCLYQQHYYICKWKYWIKLFYIRLLLKSCRVYTYYSYSIVHYAVFNRTVLNRMCLIQFHGSIPIVRKKLWFLLVLCAICFLRNIHPFEMDLKSIDAI
jgi:hypothetical protein